MRQIVINCYKFHGREDLLPTFTEEDDKNNIQLHTNVSSSVGVLKMHSSGMVPTHKIQIQANGSPQIITTSPDGLSGSSAQVCLDPAGYSSDVDVCRSFTNNMDVVCVIIETYRHFILFFCIILASYIQIIIFLFIQVGLTLLCQYD